MTVKEWTDKTIKDLAKRKERKNRISENEANSITIESIRRVKRRYGQV